LAAIILFDFRILLTFCLFIFTGCETCRCSSRKEEENGVRHGAIHSQIKFSKFRDRPFPCARDWDGGWSQVSQWNPGSIVD
jgi:hypothetical protein